MELDNEVLTGEQSVENSPSQETETGLESSERYGLRDGELIRLEDSEEEQPNEPEEVPETPQVKTYRVKVDGQELDVPETELLNGYMRQADFTRKTQELAAERERIRQLTEQSQMRTQPTPQEVPQAEQLSPAKILEGLVQKAQESAMRTLGITDSEEFDHWNPVHKTAYDLALNNLVTAFREQEVKAKTVQGFEVQLAQSDPEYNDVKSFAMQNLKYLPNVEYERFRQGFAEGNVEVMNELYSKMKKAYAIYNGKEQVETPSAPPQSVQERAKVLPPTIESGKGVTLQTSKGKPDYSVLRSMSFDEQVRQMKDWGIKV